MHVPLLKVLQDVGHLEHTEIDLAQLNQMLALLSYSKMAYSIGGVQDLVYSPPPMLGSRGLDKKQHDDDPASEAKVCHNAVSPGL